MNSFFLLAPMTLTNMAECIREKQFTYLIFSIFEKA